MGRCRYKKEVRNSILELVKQNLAGLTEFGPLMQQAGVDSVSSLSASPFTTSYCSRKMLAYTLSNSTFARTVFQSLLFQGKIFLCKITLKGQTVLFMTDVLVQFEILSFSVQNFN